MIKPGINCGEIKEQLSCDCSGGFTEFSVDDVNDFPQQGNCCNCGICPCMFVLLLSIYQPLSFDQKFVNGQDCRNRIG